MNPFVARIPGSYYTIVYTIRSRVMCPARPAGSSALLLLSTWYLVYTTLMKYEPKSCLWNLIAPQLAVRIASPYYSLENSRSRRACNHSLLHCCVGSIAINCSPSASQHDNSEGKPCTQYHKVLIKMSPKGGRTCKKVTWKDYDTDGWSKASTDSVAVLLPTTLLPSPLRNNPTNWEY